MFDEDEVMKAIMLPSDGIKSGHEAVEVELLDGETLLGRVVRSDAQSMVLLQAGNIERTIERSQMRTNRMLMTSLMPTGLVDSCSPSDLDDLLAYLKIRRAGRWERWQWQAESGFRDWRFYTSRPKKALIGAGVIAVVLGLILGVWKWVKRRMA
jgi:putative heme-binding domain-containing protein